MELAAARLALSTLSPIISKLGCYVYNSTFGGDVTAEDMRNLNDVVLFKIKTVIQEADLVPLDHLGPWLENLQAAAFEAEDLLDLYEYKRIKNQVSSLPKLVKKSIQMTKESLGFILPKSSFKICLEKLQKSAEEAEKLLPLIKSARKTAMRQLEYKNTQASTSTSTVSSLSSPLFGRENECDFIIQFLLDKPYTNSSGRFQKLPVIAVIGMGGSGKTAIAQGVYNDQRVETHFDLRMWVHVSHLFDVHRLTKDIIESATKDECPQISNLDALQIKLKSIILKHKIFLLVLDDIWCEDRMQWDQLLSPLNEVGGKGSKIIITTRLRKVASLLRADHVLSLNELEYEDCLSILKHYAFDDSEEMIKDPELAYIMYQIINKVKYSPLALRVVGSSLGKQASVNEWEKILENDMLKGPMDALLLSFVRLPSHLQRCFAYCSLFPRGHKFYLGPHLPLDLISLWVAQGFVENISENQLTLEEKGNMYFLELLSYSFFEKHPNDYYIIHDLLHTLAEGVSRKHCHRIEDLNSLLVIPTTCIHLSIYGTENLPSIDIFEISKLNKLRTLFILVDAKFTDIFNDKNDIFQNLIKLRALYVKFDQNLAVLRNPHIGVLKHLRYLHVKYDKKLPESLAKLYHLQFLYLCTVQGNTLRDPVHLKANTLPKGFGNLINLRTLIFYEDYFRKVDNWCYNSGISIEKLTSLHNLTAFCPEKDSVNGVMSLKDLNLLCGSLSISNLENVKSKVEAAEAMLNRKKNLDALRFEWSGASSSTDNSNICEEVLEGLEPHPNLEMLNVIRYEGVKAPNWMICLPRLRILSLLSCKSLKEVPYLPPRLYELHVSDCNELMLLNPPIPDTLQSLYLEDCPKLMPLSMSLRLVHVRIKRCLRNGNQLLSDILPFLTNLQTLELEGFSNIQTIPNLSPTVTCLSIKDFSELSSMGNLQLMTSLKYLTIKKCPMLMTDEPLLVEGAVEEDIAEGHPHLKEFRTDEPSLILVHVLPQSFSSIERLTLYGLNRGFPPLLEEHFHRLSSLVILKLVGFRTLPNLEKVSSMEILYITNCPDVELLPNLPISVRYISVTECPYIKVNYEEGGPLCNTISHIRFKGFD